MPCSSAARVPRPRGSTANVAHEELPEDVESWAHLLHGDSAASASREAVFPEAQEEVEAVPHPFRSRGPRCLVYGLLVTGAASLLAVRLWGGRPAGSLEHRVALALWAANDAGSTGGPIVGFGPGARSVINVAWEEKAAAVITDKCRARGCYGDYRPELPCQCNDECGHYKNCCADFVRACELQLPPREEEATRPPPQAHAPTTRPKVTTTPKHHRTARLAEGLRAAATTSKAPPTPSPLVALPRCETSAECLGLVDAFLDSQPRSFGLLQARADQTLGGGPCGAMCELPVNCSGASCGHVTYDSAMAAIYYTKRGYLDKAKAILDAFRDALYPRDASLLRPLTHDTLYRGNASRKKITLLAMSYSDERPIPGNYESPYVLDARVDTGVNAWVAIAFTHYAAAAKAPCYANVARDILGAVTQSSACVDGLGGFLARLPPHAENFRSTVGNLVILAAARLLGLRRIRGEAAHFVRGMRQDPGYNRRTGSAVRCDDMSLPEGPLPADASFWTLLSDADPIEERMTVALTFALRSPGFDGSGVPDSKGFWVQDRDLVWHGGAGSNSALYGFRYSSNGRGVQWEITASAVMAMLHFKQWYGDEELRLKHYIDRARDSLRSLLAMYKGVPNSVRGGNHKAWEDVPAGESKFPGGSDSGFGWPDLRYLTTGSTAWTGLLLLYQPEFHGYLNEDANPFSLPKLAVPVGEDTSCVHVGN
uniref:SMB domain-containing protein n=1 Tax=Alexandrium monilatum TaxID=311494 RepID=A0A7S4PSL2_9DINO